MNFWSSCYAVLERDQTQGFLHARQALSLVIWMELNAHRVPFLFVEKKFPVCGWWEQELGLCLPGICEKSDYNFQGLSFLPQTLVQVINSGPRGPVASAFIH